MQAAGEFLQVDHCLLQSLGRTRQVAPQLLQLGRDRVLDAAQFEPERDQALLCPVVQVALDLAARLVRGRDDAGPRGHQVGVGSGRSRSPPRRFRRTPACGPRCRRAGAAGVLARRSRPPTGTGRPRWGTRRTRRLPARAAWRSGRRRRRTPWTRPGARVRRTSSETVPCSRAHVEPSGMVASRSARYSQVPTVTAEATGSYRTTKVCIAPTSRPISRATASKTSVGGAACATSVARRRSAACSSAIRPSSSRLSRRASATRSRCRAASSRTSSEGTTRSRSRRMIGRSRPAGTRRVARDVVAVQREAHVVLVRDDRAVLDRGRRAGRAPSPAAARWPAAPCPAPARAAAGAPARRTARPPRGPPPRPRAAGPPVRARRPAARGPGRSPRTARSSRWVSRRLQAGGRRK